MRRGFVAFLALALVGLALTACGFNRFAEREPWRAQAEEACLAQKLVRPSAYMSMASEINGPGVCGIVHPFKVAAFSQGSIALPRKVTLGCPMIPRIDAWLEDVVQPAAELYFGAAVVEITAGTYSCRSRNNQRGAKLSEHSFGNAVDVMGVKFADGREVSVVRGWSGAAAERDFLREIFVGACRYFATVLGPGSDMFHYNHFHLDLARHDPRGERHICKPVIKFEPRIAPDAARRRPLGERPVFKSVPMQSDDPGDVEEEDGDPFAMSAATPRPGTGTARPPAAAPQALAMAPSPQARGAEPMPEAREVTSAPLPPPPLRPAAPPAAAPAAYSRGPAVPPLVPPASLPSPPPRAMASAPMPLNRQAQQLHPGQPIY
jgi:hypothetical protein